MRRLSSLLATIALILGGLATTAAARPEAPRPAPAESVTRDAQGIVHITAPSLERALYLNGWAHARDRLFQMDVTRRSASGTLAELLGKPALNADVQSRTIGLRRAAERTWDAASQDLRADLQAYTDGVNAYVADHPLPPEYAALGLTSFEPWTPIDSLTVGKALAFSLSFDNDIPATLQLIAYINAYGPVAGYLLFSQDVMRSQPFSDAATVPDASAAAAAAVTSARPRLNVARLAETARLGRAYLHKIAGLPLFAGRPQDGTQGSNEWAVAGSRTTSGRPIVANDPHLSLSAPSTFYPIALRAPGLDVAGEGFAGAPGVIVGHNRDIAWGATVNPMDVTDVYQEHVVPDPTSPSQLSTTYKGQLEHIVPIPETFRYNSGATLVTADPNTDHVPPATLIVPRRNNGPIVELDIQNQAGLSIQYTGFSATFEIETFLRWDRARNLDDFRDGLQYFDVGSQNWAYADRHGNIAYFTSSEMPVREDLQAGTVTGVPPWFIRDGTGGNEWLPVQHPQPGQAIPYEIYPADEMPHIVNPPAGWFVNANNDPAGTALDNDPLNQTRPAGGIYYLNPGYDGFRAGRITEMMRHNLRDGRLISVADIQRMQADTALLDAEYFVPWLRRAFSDAQSSTVSQLAALAADPRIAEAVHRLARWDFTTPTGIPQGYDARDVNGRLLPPTPPEIADSIAATIYAAWRSRAVTGIIDAPLGLLPKPDGAEAVTGLRHLLDTWSTSQGVGASGIDFFGVPGIADRDSARDYRLLSALAAGLDMLAGPTFDAAFHGSTNQSDYRWGLLHRVVLSHPLGDPFSVPSAFGHFPAPLTGLAGIPVDGGFETVDAASHNVRGASSNGFTFGSGPARRFVATPVWQTMRAESALPGGVSALPDSPWYLNLLRPYLTDDYYPARLTG
jgi:penicillin amidase